LLNLMNLLMRLRGKFDCLIIGGGPWNIPEDLPRTGNAINYILEFPGPCWVYALGIN
jgi:GMP synthase (glutamine-hydrolysing)